MNIVVAGLVPARVLINTGEGTSPAPTILGHQSHSFVNRYSCPGFKPNPLAGLPHRLRFGVRTVKSDLYRQDLPSNSSDEIHQY
jgi:hypothetical protein